MRQPSRMPCYRVSMTLIALWSSLLLQQQQQQVGAQRITSWSQVSTFVKHETDVIDVVVKFKDQEDSFPEFSKAMQSAASKILRREGVSRVPKSVEQVLSKEKKDDEGVTVNTQMERTNAMGLKVHKKDLEALLNDPNVESIERDRLVYPYQAVASQNRPEITPWGIPVVQAQSKLIPPAEPDSCFKVCVVDAGLLVDHPDIPYSRNDGKISGKTFNLPAGETWYSPVYGHGTHVAGIMVAEGNNNIGVQGVLENAPDSNNICMLIARVFDDAGNGQQDSVILSAAEWCADQGAKVINMSLGSVGYASNTFNNVYKSIRKDDGALVFAASGNGGDTELNYPASYDGVISVGAVDQTLQAARYSVANEEVDIVAPGSNIQSTFPVPYVYDEKGNQYEMEVMDYSTKPSTEVKSEIVDCGKLLDSCDRAEGKICLIERGEATFAKKAANCENSGGIGAIVYNDVSGMFSGTLSSSGLVDIPVVTVSRESGLELMNADKVAISLQSPGYTSLTGTSMATPYAAGVAAKIWSIRPKCTADQIEEALFATARDLGRSGRDNYYGHGLVQAENAFLYLLDLPPPCGLQAGETLATKNSSSGNQGNSANQDDSENGNQGQDGIPNKRQSVNDDSKEDTRLSDQERTRGGGRKKRALRGSKNTPPSDDVDHEIPSVLLKKVKAAK